MVCQLQADVEWLVRIGPVEDAGLLWKDFECAKLLTLRLNDLKCLESTVHHHESWLEADQF